MPQKPYMFLGSLKDQLLYPNVKDSENIPDVAFLTEKSGCMENCGTSSHRKHEEETVPNEDHYCCISLYLN